MALPSTGRKAVWDAGRDGRKMEGVGVVVIWRHVSSSGTCMIGVGWVTVSAFSTGTGCHDEPRVLSRRQAANLLCSVSLFLSSPLFSSLRSHPHSVNARDLSQSVPSFYVS